MTEGGVFLIFYKARSTGVRTLLNIHYVQYIAGIRNRKTIEIKLLNTCNALQSSIAYSRIISTKYCFAEIILLVWLHKGIGQNQNYILLVAGSLPRSTSATIGKTRLMKDQQFSKSSQQPGINIQFFLGLLSDS